MRLDCELQVARELAFGGSDKREQVGLPCTWRAGVVDTAAARLTNPYESLCVRVHIAGLGEGSTARLTTETRKA